jgi:hypothetical protein
MASKSGYALKHATGQQKMRYMDDYLELRETIRSSQGNPAPTCPRCGEVMGSRPMFMVGVYDYCFSCYEADKEKEKQAAQKLQAELAEAHAFAASFDFETIQEVSF